MRKALYVGLLIVGGIGIVIWMRSKHGSSQLFPRSLSDRSLTVNVDPHPIPDGSWVSVMTTSLPLGACLKALDQQKLGCLHESTGNNDAFQFIKKCPRDKEAWIVGQGIPGQISTTAGEDIIDQDVAGFDGVAASKLVLFACYTGALKEGAKFVSDISARTHQKVWAQNSQTFCVPGDNDSSPSQLYIYQQAKTVEASPEKPNPHAVPEDLFNPTAAEIWLSDRRVLRRVPPDSFVMTDLASVTRGPVERKTFSILKEDRQLARRFLETVDFSHPFGAALPGKVAIPLARPVIQVTFAVEGKPRTFTVYGGGLLGDDGQKDTFYLMDRQHFKDLSKDLATKYSGLFE